MQEQVKHKEQEEEMEQKQRVDPATAPRPPEGGRSSDRGNEDKPQGAQPEDRGSGYSEEENSTCQTQVGQPVAKKTVNPGGEMSEEEK